MARIHADAERTGDATDAPQALSEVDGLPRPCPCPIPGSCSFPPHPRTSALSAAPSVRAVSVPAALFLFPALPGILSLTMRGHNSRHVLCVALTPAVQELYECPHLALGEVVRLPRPLVSAAGKGVNVARMTATLGSAVVLTGFIGGATGRFIEQSLRADGVRCRLTRVAPPSRVCRTLKNLVTGEVTELVEEGACPTAAQWRAFFRIYQTLLPKARLVVIAGTLMPGAPANVYQQLTRAAQAARVPVLIDSHRDPLRQTLAHRPLIAKANVAELEKTFGKPLRSETAILKTARKLIAAGAQWVVVTHGAKGAWLIGKNEAWHYPAPQLKAVNPIGSGDAVSAGIAHALGLGRELPEAVRFGLACGAANVLTKAAGTIRVSDVRRLLVAVRCRRV